ncbi:MAG: hypothetical protein ACOY5B_16455 [Spirochaetota bacterium]
MRETPAQRPANACMSDKLSCSACCGIYNLDMTPAQRQLWLEENTMQFMALDLSLSENIVHYRRERESVTLPRRVREDTYVCPFVGFLRNQQMGCLLHPQGSPHPQIGLHAHPQNFSFYGEGICQAYDCLAKDRGVHRLDFFRWAENAELAAYGRLASDHTLHRSLALFAPAEADLAVFYGLLALAYQRYRVVTTSFEDIEKIVPDTAAALCSFLAERVAERREGMSGEKNRSGGQFARRLSALLFKTLRACLK